MSWITDAIPEDLLQEARVNASRRLLNTTLGITETDGALSGLRFAAESLELSLLDVLEDEGHSEAAVACAADAFQLLRAIPAAGSSTERATLLLRTACVGVLGDRAADVRRVLLDTEWPIIPVDSDNWTVRTVSTIIDVWLRLIRKQGWEDLDAVQVGVARLRAAQEQYEAEHLAAAGSTGAQRQLAWKLVALYHWARAAELLGTYTTQGRTEAGYDIREQLQTHFDRAGTACLRGEIVEWDGLGRLMARTASQLVDNSIWTSTRAINPTVSAFVERLVKSDRPIFELLPPQRRALREAGLRGGNRAIVVNLPTSSGKTFIAQFRMLQALNQFEAEKGWVAYVAPTRALVNQISTRLRRDFEHLNLVVERVSPALDIDGLEATMLAEEEVDRQFRVLVTTPEKLDLMIRGGWEDKIGRPLTLVVVDEAHNLALGERGIRLELLLATVNRQCANAQFLLLTPFIRNAEEVAEWLSPESHSTVELSINWQPNDRVVALSTPRASGNRRFSTELRTLHTNRHTLEVPERLTLGTGRPLGFTHREVETNASSLAAVTAHYLKSRGPVVVLAARPDWAWSLARKLDRDEQSAGASTEVGLVQRFLAAEYGEDFELIRLLESRIGVHHAGLSDEARRLMEWLFENEELDVLVATTTIAQGVNFPVSSVVIAQHMQFSEGRMAPMAAADFWNIAGRAGRADQAHAGVIALAAPTAEKAEALEQFVGSQVEALNSTLIGMLERALTVQGKLDLSDLFWQPQWSAFLQYLAHSYRQLGDGNRFAQQVEQILRGTLGFQKIRSGNREAAQLLIEAAQAYGTRLTGKPLGLVDSTGFSWESVSRTLHRLSEERVQPEVWDPDTLFSSQHNSLPKLMGVLLDIPELRESLREVVGGRSRGGDLLARILIDWVHGASLADLAREHFQREREGRESRDFTHAMTECCRNLFGRLTQTAAWGLGALQAMTLPDDFDERPTVERDTVRNLPSRVFYGVNSDEAIAMRMLGIPRTAAQPLADVLQPGEQIDLPSLRRRLVSAEEDVWREALGEQGVDYRRVWEILET